jgi:hypothetical protein
MHTPQELHLTALKRILRYLRGSLDYDLAPPTIPDVGAMVYTNADWAVLDCV